MLKFLEQRLSEFRSCFSRTATYNWFLIIVTGLMIRFDSLGVTSFIGALSLDHRFYESMLHFFRSNAFKTQTLKKTPTVFWTVIFLQFQLSWNGDGLRKTYFR